MNPTLSLIFRHKRLVAVFLFLGLLLAVFQFSGLKENLSLVFLKHTILDNKVSGLLLFIVLFALGNLIHFPGSVFLAAAVLTLGKGIGGMATYVAASTSCVFTFFIVRAIGGDALRRLDNRITISFFGHLDSRPITSIILLRVLFQSLPSLNYALALSGIRFWHYLVGTLLGLPLPIIVYCLFFDYLAKILGIQ